MLDQKIFLFALRLDCKIQPIYSKLAAMYKVGSVSKERLYGLWKHCLKDR